MMTKTTNKTKSVLLKTAVMPAVAVLLYFLSTETVAIAKTPDHKATPVLIAPEITAVAPEAVDSIPGAATATNIDSLKRETATALTAVNKFDAEARKNQYFSGVRIVIVDEQKGKYIDMPYEQLSVEDRYYYLPLAPKKMQGGGVSLDDYNYSLFTMYNTIGGLFYLDDKKVSRDEILKHKKEDFASYANRASDMTVVDGKLTGNMQSFFYTHDYYNKNLKRVNDHYPDKTLKITIADKPGKTWLGMQVSDEEKASGKTDAEILKERAKKDLEADYYPTIEKIKEKNRTLNAYFPGGDDKFNEYINTNLNISGKTGGKQIVINFTINTDGTISNAWVMNNKDEQLAADVKRVFENSPKWIPAQLNGKPYQNSVSAEFPRGL